MFRTWRMLMLCLVAPAVCVGVAGCGDRSQEAEGEPQAVPIVVTADIQAGIEKYIEEQTLAGNGYYRLPFRDRNLELKLVKVHTEYLANLGPRRHFACIDLVGTDGEVYDVDFFLAGDPGAMNVTETTVHKINGQPLYTWEQAQDKTWHRVPIEGASPGLLGVIHGEDEFEFVYKATLPEIKNAGRMWLPIPESDRFQTVTMTSIDVPGTRRELTDRDHGNKVLLLELGAEDGGKSLDIRYRVKRREVAAYEESGDPNRYLKPELLVPASEQFREIARTVVERKKGDLVRARALYDHVIDRMGYKKHGTGWGKGDAVFACDIRRGNCTDFHSYFIALARAVGIPARFAIGAGIPSSRNEGGVDGYHCWAEFYAEGKWWPVDISEGDKYSSLATYYFGHHPANRVEFSRGRDLVLEPGPLSGPINFLAYPVLEIDGKPAKAAVQFLFSRDTKPG